jgi:VIT1/CCC1 family predicted Fe2+/Mn2+ transporter
MSPALTGTAPEARRSPLLRPAIFGLADGCMSMLGVLLYLLHHQNLIFPAALMGGISAAVSMAGGEWMSDSDNGFFPSAVMGLATGAGGILPAVPFALARGPLALTGTVVICLLIAGAVGAMRGRVSTKHGAVFEMAVTLLLLAAIFGIVLFCSVIVPNPG